MRDLCDDQKNEMPRIQPSRLRIAFCGVSGFVEGVAWADLVFS